VKNSYLLKKDLDTINIQDVKNDLQLKDDSKYIRGDLDVKSNNNELVYPNLEKNFEAEHDQVANLNLKNVCESVSKTSHEKTLCAIDKEPIPSPYDKSMVIANHEVNEDLSGKSGPLKISSLVNQDQQFMPAINANFVNSIPCVQGAVGMALLDNGLLVTVMQESGEVALWDNEARCIKKVVHEREFKRPSDVVNLPGSGFAVLEESGILTFDMKGEFCKLINIAVLDTPLGMTLDEGQILVIINKCLPGDQGKLTLPGETDLFYLDISLGEVVKRVQMVDIIDDASHSRCQSLCIFDEKLHIVDNGLDCIYSLFYQDGEDQAEVFGCRGREEAQFSGISCIALDFEGSMLISDMRNNRIQAFSKDWMFYGFVKVNRSPFHHPRVVCIDKELHHLIVHNVGTSEIVRYSLE